MFAGAVVADALLESLFSLSGGGAQGLAGADEVLISVCHSSRCCLLLFIISLFRNMRHKILKFVPPITTSQGPAGIVARRSELAALLTAGSQSRTGKTPAISFLCDGCALLTKVQPAPMPAVGVRSRCSTDSNCPPSVALPLAVPLWGSTAPQGCTHSGSDLWQCLAAEVLLAPPNPAFGRAREGGGDGGRVLPLLVQAQQFDTVQLAAHGVDAR